MPGRAVAVMQFEQAKAAKAAKDKEAMAATGRSKK